MKPCCSIEGCVKPVLARGWCCTHYNRWNKFGDPVHPVQNRSDNGAGLRLIAAAPDTDDCLLWPQAQTKGYGAITFEGRNTYAHRVSLIIHKGDPPTPKHQAAHSCCVPLCYNPKHLRWATVKENAQDRFLHGTELHGSACLGALLTEEDARAIVSCDTPGNVLAAELGVSSAAIYAVRKGKTWNRATGLPRRRKTYPAQ